MKLGTSLLRFLSLYPAALALVLLAVMLFFSLSGWVIFVVLVPCALIIGRCAYLAWRRPSPAIIREVRQWTCFVLSGFVYLSLSTNRWIAWIVLGLLLTVEPQVSQFLIRKTIRPAGNW
jgi:hypothetical protein